MTIGVSNLPRPEVEDFFKRMDRDFDGRLTFGEFMGEETALEKVFKKMDTDGGGTVTKEVKLIVIIHCLMSLFSGIPENMHKPVKGAG
jgi:Ca2+-binding EF-hand superfamily protein